MVVDVVRARDNPVRTARLRLIFWEYANKNGRRWRVFAVSMVSHILCRRSWCTAMCEYTTPQDERAPSNS